jgi:hypothetical protein
MIVYMMLAYTLFDVAFDLWRSRRVSRERKVERSRHDLLYLLYKLDIKSAEAPLDRAYQRRLRKRHHHP